MARPISNDDEDPKTKDSGETSIPFWRDAVGTWNPMSSGIEAWASTCGKTTAALTSEWFDFLNRRCREEVALFLRLASCHSSDESWRAFAEFWQKAIDDYRQEFAELSRLGSEAMTASMTDRCGVLGEPTKGNSARAPVS